MKRRNHIILACHSRAALAEAHESGAAIAGDGVAAGLDAFP